MSTDLGVRGHADRSHDRGTAAPALVPSPVAHGLSAALAVTAVSAALPTVLLDGVLHGPPGMNGSARGTALVMIVLGVPMLLAGQAGTRRGWSPALPVWLGAVSNLLYNGFMLLFATPFNRLFLLYVATFLLALWSLVAVLRVVDIPALGARVAPGVPRRAIAVFVWVLVALNAAAWLKGIVPGMGQGADPAFLVGTGLTTFPTYVQYLAVWLPLLAVAAYWLWRGLAWGYLVVASVLVMWVVEAVWLHHRGTEPGRLFTSLRCGSAPANRSPGRRSRSCSANAPEPPAWPPSGSPSTHREPGTPPAPPSPASPWTGSPSRLATNGSPPSSSARSARPRPWRTRPAATSGL